MNNDLKKNGFDSKDLLKELKIMRKGK